MKKRMGPRVEQEYDLLQPPAQKGDYSGNRWFLSVVRVFGGSCPRKSEEIVQLCLQWPALLVKEKGEERSSDGRGATLIGFVFLRSDSLGKGAVDFTKKKSETGESNFERLA